MRSGILEQLDSKVWVFKAQALSVNTQRTYCSQMRTFVKFCESAQIGPVPVAHRDLCCYVAYLASFLSYNSVRQYLNVVRLMHLEAGFPNPLQSFSLDMLLRGVKRSLGCPSKPKLPMSINLLHAIRSTLDLTLPSDACFWGACLMGFFSLLRKSNLLPQRSQPNPSVITRGDLVFEETHLLISVRHSKTNQYQQRVFQVAVPPPSVLHWLHYK